MFQISVHKIRLEIVFEQSDWLYSGSNSWSKTSLELIKSSYPGTISKIKHIKKITDPARICHQAWNWSNGRRRDGRKDLRLVSVSHRWLSKNKQIFILHYCQISYSSYQGSREWSLLSKKEHWQSKWTWLDYCIGAALFSRLALSSQTQLNRTYSEKKNNDEQVWEGIFQMQILAKIKH